MANDPRGTDSRLLAYCQLIRLPNVFTAMADVAMGFLFTHGTLKPPAVFILLLISSAALYSGGMVMNDTVDLAEDRRWRPNRPLPSGRVSLTIALKLTWMLPLIGMLAGCGTAILVGSFWPAAIAIVLTVMIIAYNGLKQTIAGPAMMGGCRTLNVLLGMSAAGEAWGKANWIVAIGVGVYVGGITWFARREAESSDRSQLVGGLLVMIAGMALVWLFPTVSTQERLTYLLQFEPWYWTLAWLLLAVLISAPFVRALANPRPENVQRAVKSGILSIIVLDAVIAFAVSGPFAAIGILLLLVPAIVLGRWIYST